MCGGTKNEREVGLACAKDDARDLLPVRVGCDDRGAAARDAATADRPLRHTARARHTRHGFAHSLYGRRQEEVGR